MKFQQNLTSHKKAYTLSSQSKYFLSPTPKSMLQQHFSELQLLNQEQVISKLKHKKQDILKQSQNILQNCHHYFMDLTSVLMETQNRVKKSVDKQTLNFLEEIQAKIQQIKQNQNSYNCNTEIFQTIKILAKNFTQTQQNINQVGKIIQKCYHIDMEGFTNQQQSDIGMSTNKIYISSSEFITTNKKVHGNLMQISQKQFEMTLHKFQQREQKNMLLNQRLKSKIKSLEQILSKKGVNIKQLNRMTTAQNQKCSQDYWDLQLQRIKGQNSILTQQINNISNKLISLTSQNQSLKGEYKKMLQSNISHTSNQNNTISPQYQNQISLQQNSRFMTQIQSQNFITSQIMLPNLGNKEIQQKQSHSIVCLPSSLHTNMQNEILVEYDKKNQQLSLELTKKLKQMQELRQEIDNLQTTIEEVRNQNQQKQNQLIKISQHCHTLEHDYEVSSKKRFQLQQKLTQTKISMKISQQNQKSLTIQSQLRIQNLQSMLKIKEEAIQKCSLVVESKLRSQYDQIIASLKKSNSQIQSEMILCRKLLKQAETENQLKVQNFKTQFKRLQKTISSKDQQISNLREQMYAITKQVQQSNQTKIDQNNQSWKQKYQTNKKQLNKIKKELKQKIKDIQNYKSQNTKMNQLLGIKCVQINTKMEYLIKETQNCKSINEGKIKVLQEKIKIIKQRFQFNLSELISIPQIEGRKINYYEHIQRYIESMNNFCSKNAELKKLKDQIKQLKSTKSVGKLTKKQLTKDFQNYTKNLEHNSDELTQIQKTLIQDRLKVQKGILQEKLSIFEEQNKLIKQKLISKQKSFKQVFQELTKIKKQVKKAQIQSKKQLSGDQQLSSQIKFLQNKVQKSQNELKSSKNLVKKCQQQLTSTQNQLKKKKDHITNIKKQHSALEQKIQQLNFILKNKSQDIQRLKRQLKDQSTKDLLVNQMKQKVEEYTKLQSQNQQLKRQVQKITANHRFQVSKLQVQIKQLKTDKKLQLNQKINQKTFSLNEQINDLKSKYKKAKSELQRKETLMQHTRTKYENQLNEAKADLDQALRELNNRLKQSDNYEKKIEIMSINQRKYKDRSKLLSVVVKKVYEKILNDTKIGNTRNKKHNSKQKQNASSLLQNTSPIARVFHSNVFNNTLVSPQISKQSDNPTLQTLAQLDINFSDLDKYSQGLQMFGVNASQLKNIQTGLYDIHNEMSTFSHFMSSPEGKNQTTRNHQRDKSPSKQHRKSHLTNFNYKQMIQKLTDRLDEAEEMNVTEIVKLFDQILQ